MKNILRVSLFLTLLNNYNIFSQNITILVWNDEYDCIFNKYIEVDSVDIILNNIADTLAPKYLWSTRPETGDKLVKMNMTRQLFVYVGMALTEEDIINNSIYLESYLENNFYKEESPWFSNIPLNDTSILQVSNQGLGPLKTNTELANGKWFLYVVNDKKVTLIKEVTVAQNELNGRLIHYGNTDRQISQSAKFKNGILVDTFAVYSNNKLSGFEIRDSTGFYLWISAGFYPNSSKYGYFTDYKIGYAFTFYENGYIATMVRVENYIETGNMIKFDMEGNIIKEN